MVDAAYPDSLEPQYYPGTNTYINRFGITNSAQLKEKEASFTAVRSIELYRDSRLIAQTFDFAYLKAIHYYLFQDLYDWAGMPGHLI